MFVLYDMHQVDIVFNFNKLSFMHAFDWYVLPTLIENLTSVPPNEQLKSVVVKNDPCQFYTDQP